jgi:hypothetical protein
MNNSMPQGKPVHRTVQTAPRAVTENRVAVLWSTVIGKKIVMATTGSVLFLFVIMHMIGNLKIFHGPSEINAYAAFLREMGQPELGYGQLLWLVRIVLLACLFLHVTAVVQLTRMNRRARPVGYNMKKNVETTIAALTMRWGGFLLLLFVIFHLLHLTVEAVGFSPASSYTWRFTKTWSRHFRIGRLCSFTWWQWLPCVCTCTTESGVLFKPLAFITPAMAER